MPPVLIVCPASVKSQWRSEILRFSGRDCQIVLGGAAERAAQYENECFFTICNYEQVLRDILAIERAKWDLIVLDEGQRIKNWEAKTTQTMKSLRSPFALVLSGTPLENRLDDLFSVVEFIDDRRLGPAFRFYNRHRVTDEKGKVLGYKDLDLLRESLKPVLLRRTRSAVMKDLPPRTTEIVRIAEAGGQLLTAAFTFLGEMIPQREPTDGAARMAREFKDRLNECLERDDQGRPRLTVTLPDETALANLARSLAALLA